MADAFVLEWKVDQPAVLAGESKDVYVLITVKPNPNPPADAPSLRTLPAHLLVMVDVSGSMQTPIREAGGSSADAANLSLPSRLAVAQRVVGKLVRRLEPQDRMTLVAFDDRAHPLATCAPGSAQVELTAAVERLAEIGGGGTSMGRGLGAVIKALETDRQDNAVRRIVLLTDGKDQDRRLALRQAMHVGREMHVPIHAFGTGESRADFLTQVCKTTLGGGFRDIRTDLEAEQCFDEVFTGQKNVVATNVALRLWLSPEIYVQDLYRTRPEVLYVGAMKPEADRAVMIPIETMEKGKAYSFLFRSTVPAKGDGRRFRLAKATLSYDMPGLALTGQKLDANIAVEYTGDANRAMVYVGEVRRAIAQAEVQRQVLFLQSKIDLLDAGHGTDKDRLIVTRLLQVLIKKHEEFGDQATVNMYRAMQDEFLAKGSISQEMLNRSLAASSRVHESATVQEIDDF